MADLILEKKKKQASAFGNQSNKFVTKKYKTSLIETVEDEKVKAILEEHLKVKKPEKKNRNDLNRYLKGVAKTNVVPSPMKIENKENEEKRMNMGKETKREKRDDIMDLLSGSSD